jgi:hypothetical protein
VLSIKKLVLPLKKEHEEMGRRREGEIKMAVDAQSEEGFDRNRLRNAVKKPLEEAGIEIKISEE